MLPLFGGSGVDNFHALLLRSCVQTPGEASARPHRLVTVRLRPAPRSDTKSLNSVFVRSLAPTCHRQKQAPSNFLQVVTRAQFLLAAYFLLTSRVTGRRDAVSIPKFRTYLAHMSVRSPCTWRKSLRQQHLRPSRYLPPGRSGATELVNVSDRTLDSFTGVWRGLRVTWGLRCILKNFLNC